MRLEHRVSKEQAENEFTDGVTRSVMKALKATVRSKDFIVTDDVSSWRVLSRNTYLFSVI